MANECVCVHALRCSFVSRAGVAARANAVFDFKTQFVGLTAAATFNAAVDHATETAVNSGASFAVFRPAVLSSASLALATSPDFVIDPLEQPTRGLRANLVAVALFTGAANTTLESKPNTFRGLGENPPGDATRTVGLLAALSGDAVVTLRPRMTYDAKLTPKQWQPATTKKADKTVGLFLQFNSRPSFGGQFDYTNSLAADLTVETTLGLYPCHGALSATLLCEARFGNEMRVTVTNVLDNVNPNTGRIVAGRTTNDTTPTFTGTAAKNTNVAIGVNGYLVAVVPATNGNWTYTSSGLADGFYGFLFVAFDDNGYISQPARFDLNVDTVPPAAPVLLSVTDAQSPIKGSVLSGAKINDSAPVFKGFAEAFATIKITDQFGGEDRVQASSNGSWQYKASLSDGQYQLSFVAVDAAENVSPAISFTLTIDTEKPNKPTVSATDSVGNTPTVIVADGYTNDNRPVFSGTADSDSKVVIKANGKTLGTANGGSWTYKPNKLYDGKYKFSFVAVDAAGNESEPRYLTFTIKTHPPAEPIVTSEEVGYGEETANTTPNFIGRARAHTQVFVATDNEVPHQIEIDNDGMWTFTPAEPLEDGDHVFHFLSRDMAGNFSQSKNFPLKIKTQETTLPLRTAPRILATTSTPFIWQLYANDEHATTLSLKAQTRIVAPLMGPGGVLTRITRKKKLRLLPKRAPGTLPEEKKYIWRFPVVKKGMSCGCCFIHVGVYDLRCGPWKTGQEREVLLLVADIIHGDIWETPVLYPQYLEDGNYRVVKVKNLMYDIEPPMTFVRSEPVGQNIEDRTFIFTDTARLVFVFEGCGESFFLINAECE